MKIILKGPVGNLNKKQGNLPEDVKAVKQILKKLDIAPDLVVDTNVNVNLITAIKKFQKLFMKQPDGRIDPQGETIRRLNKLADGKAIVVHLKQQILDAYSNLTRIYHLDCVAGDAMHPTPPGYYAIQPGRKYRKYRSRTYDAQMDYAMFFYHGYAIHMAYMVGVSSYLKWAGVDSLGSHGCVRLSESDASILFDWTPVNTPVVILPRE
jgi:lipoprotein-anchoring transpeptidase ErfK/SrfK